MLITETNFKGIKESIEEENKSNVEDLYVEKETNLGSCIIDNKLYWFRLTKTNKYKKNSLKIDNIK